MYIKDGKRFNHNAPVVIDGVDDDGPAWAAVNGKYSNAR